MKSQVLDNTLCWSKDNGTKSQQKHGDDIVGDRERERESDRGQLSSTQLDNSSCYTCDGINH